MKVSNRLLDQPDMANAGEAPLQALDLLYEVIDPELGVNIVDLGLVYSLDIEGAVARVQMTMTTPACPLGDYLSDAVEFGHLKTGCRASNRCKRRSPSSRHGSGDDVGRREIPIGLVACRPSDFGRCG